MGIGDLFKSTKELEAEAKRKRRAMEREVENAIERSQERINALEKERKQTWNKARELMANGQRTEAARLVQTYQMQGLQISKMEKVKLYAQINLDKISSAQNTRNVAATLKKLVTVMELDPDAIADDMDIVAGASADIKDIDRVISKAADKEQNQMLAEAEADKEGSVENAELMAALEKEAAASIRGNTVAEGTPKQGNAAADDINAGRDRLKSLLNSK